MVLGLLSDLPRKNCWSIAEWAGEASPDGMQHLLGRARWDADAVRDDMREYVVEHLHDLDAVVTNLREAGANPSSRDEVYEAARLLRRCTEITRVLVEQFTILETMLPTHFLAFRGKLEPASGFQSEQFRELEFLLGYKRASALAHVKPEFPGADRLQQRLQERTVIDHFYDFLQTRGARIPDEIKNRDVTKPNEPNEQVQREILKLYKDSPEVTILFELMTDFDEGLQEWRYRHIKLVERTIGAKKGTGGSPGVPFLKQSLFQPIFADLWAIRHEM